MTDPTAASAGEGRVNDAQVARDRDLAHRRQWQMLQLDARYPEELAACRALLATTLAKLEEVEAERDEALATVRVGAKVGAKLHDDKVMALRASDDRFQAGVREGFDKSERAVECLNGKTTETTRWGEGYDSGYDEGLDAALEAIRAAREPQEGGA